MTKKENDIKKPFPDLMKDEKDHSPKPKKLTKKEVEMLLIENFVNMQKVLTNLSAKFENLSNNVSRLLELFEASAKDFADKYPEINSQEAMGVDKEFLKKLDSLLDQNKAIAKGIILMEEKIRQKNAPPEPQERVQQPYNQMQPSQMTQPRPRQENPNQPNREIDPRFKPRPY